MNNDDNYLLGISVKCFSLSKADFMLPHDHPAVKNELARRKRIQEERESEVADEEVDTKRRKKGSSEKEPHDSLVEREVSTKWKSMHFDLAEKCTSLSFCVSQLKYKLQVGNGRK